MQKYNLLDLDSLLPRDFDDDMRARAKTIFFKKLSRCMHVFFGGKMQTLPKVGIWDAGWFNVWYTPGVSAISTAIRDDVNSSFDFSARGNLVGIVTDSTRVLGDGDVKPEGGIGVMEGKALLMKYLAGIDAVSLCVNNRAPNGVPIPEKLIDFVQMISPSFGAINLEDISQPNCFFILDELRRTSNIPVWHDDAQGTACVTLAALINALLLAGKNISNVKIVLLGAGAANTTIATFLLQFGADPARMIILDINGGLHSDRFDIAEAPYCERKWTLCNETNPFKINSLSEAIIGADVLIALSQPGPNVIAAEHVAAMNKNAIVFACANPVPEIYPHTAHAAGAFIVATGRGDFKNQVNNSLGFPGILKGALAVRSTQISDAMALAAAQELAVFAQNRGITPDNIIPTMDETDVFPREAAAVAAKAMQEGLARKICDPQVVLEATKADILRTRAIIESMMAQNFIEKPNPELIETVLQQTISEIRTASK